MYCGKDMVEVNMSTDSGHIIILSIQCKMIKLLVSVQMLGVFELKYEDISD